MVSMDGVVIRPAVLSDVESIARLEEIAFPIPWSSESIRHDITDNENAIIVVAEADGEFAGYADVWQVVGEGELNNIAVMPGFRGRRIGQAIMEDLFARLIANHNTVMTLEVRDGNLAAIRLYEKLGFREVGRRRKYYLDNGDDAILMSKDLREKSE